MLLLIKTQPIHLLSKFLSLILLFKKLILNLCYQKAHQELEVEVQVAEEVVEMKEEMVEMEEMEEPEVMVEVVMVVVMGWRRRRRRRW